MPIYLFKNHPKTLLIIGQNPFIPQSSPGHSPQPKIDFPYYEISGPNMCSLICGAAAGVRLPFLIGSSFQHPNLMTFPSKLWFLQLIPKNDKNLKWKIISLPIFKIKTKNLIIFLKKDCLQLSLEVYYIFIAQKLKIFETVKHFFLAWTFQSGQGLGHFEDLQRPKFWPQQPQ